MATTVGSAAHGAGTLREAKCLPDSKENSDEACIVDKYDKNSS